MPHSTSSGPLPLDSETTLQPAPTRSSVPHRQVHTVVPEQENALLHQNRRSSSQRPRSESVRLRNQERNENCVEEAQDWAMLQKIVKDPDRGMERDFSIFDPGKEGDMHLNWKETT